MKTITMGYLFVILVAFLALSSSFSFAFDPRPLQDICVATDEPNDSVFVNGKFCKDPRLATANDFSYSGLRMPGNTSNRFGFNATPANVEQIPGLNTLGISMARIDYAPYGVNPPHTHPRATEMLIIIEGTVFAGFVTSNPDNRLIGKTLQKGDVYVFPIGLVHFNYNVGKTRALAISALNSQNPGVNTIANAVFGSRPSIDDDFLSRSFQVDEKTIDRLQSQFNNT